MSSTPSSIKQLSGTVEQITGYSNSRKVPAGAEARRFSDLQESLNTLQKNLVVCIYIYKKMIN